MKCTYGLFLNAFEFVFVPIVFLCKSLKLYVAYGFLVKNIEICKFSYGFLMKCIYGFLENGFKIIVFLLCSYENH